MNVSPLISKFKDGGMSIPGLIETSILASRLGTNWAVSSIRIILPNGSDNWGRKRYRKGGTSLRMTHLGEDNARTSSLTASVDQARARKEVFPTIQYWRLSASNWALCELKKMRKRPLYICLQNMILSPSLRFHRLWNHSSTNFLGGHFWAST